MSKSVPKRRLNKRAKRSIRRATAFVMLITSLVVAAIPVPEAAATEEDGGPTTGSTSTIEYPTQFTNFDVPHTLVTSLDKTGKTEQDAYTVTQLSDGQWQLEWQFKFFTENGERGVISQYNSTYFNREVTLNPNVKMGYEVVEKETYDKFYTDEPIASLKYEITYEEYRDKQETNKQAKPFFDEFFPGAYETRAKIWDKYTEDLAKWEALSEEEKGKQPKPELKEGEKALSQTPLSLTKEQKLKFYCFYNEKYPGATLVEVIDYRKGVTSPNPLAYMPKGGNGETKDENGFWYDKSKMASIIAIGEEAFKDITNVDILRLPQEIRYIGKKAFEKSFIQEVTFENVETIGHEAFKGCSQLRTVTLNKGTTTIGNEAFYDTGITSIIFPWTISRIGGGAFAACRNLQTVDFSGITQQDGKIDEFAFFNDTALNTVNFGSCTITDLGKAAFAVTNGVTGSLDMFAFPAKIATTDKLGDYMFAGRTNMKKVVMPADFGRQGKGVLSEVPSHTFEGCINLEWVEFPADGGGSCGYASYKPELFKNVINKDFYVRGPELDRENQKAMPRKSTWAAHTQVSKYIPYVYKKNGVDYYEVSKDNYLLLIDSKGTLTSCVVVEKGTLEKKFELIIPEQVGTIRVQSIAPGCFDEDPKIKEKVGKITIKDGSVSQIGNAVFKDCPMLDEVYVGDSVNAIGNEAFANCPQLTNITFNTPANGNYAGFTIGTNALTTGSDKLTVHADVVDGYAPFTWAMNPSNYVDKMLGTRVCYKGLAPRYMTAIIDNDTNLPTLVGYPRYDRIKADNQTYIDNLTFYYLTKYGKQTQTTPPATYDDTETPDTETPDTETPDTETPDTETPDTETPDTETPDVETPDVETPDVETPDTEIPDTTLTCNCPDPRKYDIDNRSDVENYAKEYDIVKKYEEHVLNGVPVEYEWQTMTPMELEIINATKNLVVPSGIASIDAYQFFTDENGKNGNNIKAYFKTVPEDINYKMCQSGQGSIKDEIQPGIFSGFYKDYDTTKQPEEAALYEKLTKGNDRVESITLTSVQYLPPYAFDSCERLKTVILGDACKDIGIAPFRGCTNLVNVGGNAYYTSENGIIYSKKADGTLQIEECLAARGSSGENSIGTKYINSVTDPLLANVSSIAEGAFQNCDYISKVDFSIMEKVKSIPKSCFNECDSLSDVILPVTVNEIQEEAFSDTPIGLYVTIPGIEVSIEDTAFDHNEGTIRTYKDSAAYTYARYHNIDTELLSEKHRVTFLDYDGTELSVQLVEDGGTAVDPEVPKRKGYTFTGWSDDYKNVTKDLWLIAQYKPDSGNGNNGNGNNSNTGGGSSNGGDTSSDNTTSNKNGIYNVTVINGTGSGTYKKGDQVTITANGPATGQKFDKWVTSSLNVAMANVTSVSTTFTMPDNTVVVTATYKSDGSRPATGGNTGTTTSGNNTTVVPGNTNGTTVKINKPGISNTNLASAVVHGSSDKFMVVISDSAEATAAIEAALQGQYGDRFGALRYVGMDISLYDATGTAKIENPQGLSIDITIPIPDALIQYGGNNRAIAVTDGNLEQLGTRFTVIDGVPCMTFTATHFSPYGVYTDTENLTASMDMTPKTGDGIHPKWFLAIGLMCASIVLFTKKDEKKKFRTA